MKKRCGPDFSVTCSSEGNKSQQGQDGISASTMTIHGVPKRSVHMPNAGE
jgi:hypothetical protein